jgi:hypothetical protein
MALIDRDEFPAVPVKCSDALGLLGAAGVADVVESRIPRLTSVFVPGAVEQRQPVVVGASTAISKSSRCDRGS